MTLTEERKESFRVINLVRRKNKYRDNDAYREKMVLRARSRKFLKNYGITIEQYEKMLQKQNRCCAICGMEENSQSSLGNKKALHVDHDHRTGKIRKLLCSRCNSAIGYIRDDQNIARRIAEYLQEHSNV